MGSLEQVVGSLEQGMDSLEQGMGNLEQVAGNLDGDVQDSRDDGETGPTELKEGEGLGQSDPWG